jgi:hypothetical protein
MFHHAAFTPPRSGQRTLRVVIFYNDIASADRALRSVRDALRREGDERVLDPMLWNVGLLEEAQWLRLAASDVASADLCVLSLGYLDARANDAALWLRELAPRLARHWVTLEPFEGIAEDRQLRLQAG